MGIIWSYISLAETAETIALREGEARAGRREIGEQTHWTWFLGLAAGGREVFLVLIGHLQNAWKMEDTQ